MPSPRELEKLSSLMLYSAERGEVEEVIDLLSRGADVNALDEYGYTALVWAAKRGDLALTEALIGRGAKVNPTDPNETSPLMWAIREKHGGVAERLLSASSDVWRKDKNGDTALHLAAARGNLNLVKQLLDLGAEIDPVDSHYDTPLTLAAAGAYFDVALHLAGEGADINIQGNGGKTAYLLAVTENRITTEDKLRILNELSSRGADPNIADDYGWTPLMLTARAGNAPLVEYLLPLSKEIDRQDGQGITAFMWSASGGHVDVMRLLHQAGAAIDSKDAQSQTALFRQMRDPKLDVVQFLLERGADINAVDSRGNTVLMAAVQKQNEEMVKLLLAHGVDSSTPGVRGETPLDYALSNRMDSMAHLLNQQKAASTKPMAESLGLADGLEAQDDRGWTPLGKAARDGDIAQINILLDAGANIDGPGSHGDTPLMIAAQRSGEEVVECLLNRGAGVSAADAQGDMPLYYAIAGQRPENLKLLLDTGADINSQNSLGITPLMAALKNYDFEMAGVILEQGPDLNIQDKRGRTALMYAVSSQNTAFAERLVSLGADDTLEDNEGQTARQQAANQNQPEMAQLLGAPENESTLELQIIAEVTRKTDAIRQMMPQAFKIEAKVELPDAIHKPGFVLPADREVDCECDVAMHRPVFRDHTGINFRVSACVRCGAVTVTESLVEEPRPHDVQCVGNLIIGVEKDAQLWLAEWPRLAWGVWQEDRSIYLPADLRLESRDQLREYEQAELAAQKSLSVRDRLLKVGVPQWQAPRSLPHELKSFSESWTGIQLTESTPLDRLLSHSDSSTWASPFAHAILLRRPNIGDEVAAMLLSRDPIQFRAAKNIVDRTRMSTPAIVSAVIELVKSAPLTEPALYPLLDTLYYLGASAAEARPLLIEIAEKVGERNYYFHKRILDIHKLLAPNPNS